LNGQKVCFPNFDAGSACSSHACWRSCSISAAVGHLETVLATDSPITHMSILNTGGHLSDRVFARTKLRRGIRLGLVITSGWSSHVRIHHTSVIAYTRDVNLLYSPTYTYCITYVKLQYRWCNSVLAWCAPLSVGRSWLYVVASCWR
jgi:hypothetical protein